MTHLKNDDVLTVPSLCVLQGQAPRWNKWKPGRKTYHRPWIITDHIQGLRRHKRPRRSYL